MKNYYIEVPVLVKVMVGIEAESKEEAKEKLFGAEITIDIKDQGDHTDWLDYEWEMHEQLLRGNVWYGSINEIDIEEDE